MLWRRRGLRHAARFHSPTFSLDPLALQAFEKYVAQFERNVAAPYAAIRKDVDRRFFVLRVTKSPSRPASRWLSRARTRDIAGGSIHHFSGAMHIAGATIANVRQIMQDYPNYPKYFKPDVGKGSR